MQYKLSVLIVQSLCTGSTRPLYRLYNNYVLEKNNIATDKFTYKRPLERGRGSGLKPSLFFSLIPRTLFVIPKISENIEIYENRLYTSIFALFVFLGFFRDLNLFRKSGLFFIPKITKKTKKTKISNAL